MPKTAKEVELNIGKCGYVRISLGGQRYYLHRLIAEQTKPNLWNLTHVNHKDGDKLNNDPDNLEWVTPGDNVRHAFKNGLMNPLKGKDKRPWCHKQVKDDSGNIYHSIVHASYITGINRTSIMSCLSGRYKSAGGKRWNYA